MEIKNMKTTLLRPFVCTLALLSLFPFAAASAQTTASPAEARAIAKEAYIYGYPMVDGYRVQYDFFRGSPEPRIQGALEPYLQRG
jgi:hypothetical protein